MNLKELYTKAVKIGIENDPRGKQTVLGELKKDKNK